MKGIKKDIINWLANLALFIFCVSLSIIGEPFCNIIENIINNIEQPILSVIFVVIFIVSVLIGVLIAFGGSFVLFFALLVGGFPVLIKRIDEGNAIVTPENIVVYYFRECESIWRWDSRLKGNRLVFLDHEISLEQNAHPIIVGDSRELELPGENGLMHSYYSKVLRVIKYKIKFQLKDESEEGALKSAQKFYLAVHSGSVEIQLKKMLFNFNNQHDHDMGQLFNPYEEKQHQQFQSWMDDFFADYLESVGLEIRSVNFNLS